MFKFPSNFSLPIPTPPNQWRPNVSASAETGSNEALSVNQYTGDSVDYLVVRGADTVHFSDAANSLISCTDNSRSGFKSYRLSGVDSATISNLGEDSSLSCFISDRSMLK